MRGNNKCDANDAVSCNDVIDNDYCPYDRVTVWSNQKDLLDIYNEKDTRAAFLGAVMFLGKMVDDYDIGPNDLDEQKEFVKHLLIDNIKKQILWMNFCLKWLERVAQPDGWDMYEHDKAEILNERKDLIKAFYDLDPNGYLHFLIVADETKDFDYWDPVIRNEHTR